MRQSHRLIWNSMVIWAMRVLRLFPEVLLIPFIIHRLGAAEYGIFILAWSVFPIMDRIRDGVGSALVKYSAGYFEQGRIDLVNQMLSSACVLLGGWGLFGGLLVFIGANMFPQWLSLLSPEHIDDLRFSLNVMAAMVTIVFPLMPFTGILHAKQRYDLFAVVNTSFAYLRIGVIVGWFLFAGPSLRALVVISATSLIASSTVFVWIAFRHVPPLKMQPAMCDTRSITRITNFGIVVVLVSVCSLINTAGVNWLMGFLESAAMVGIMAIVIKPSQLMKEVIDAMSLSVMPAASKYAAQDNLQVLSQLYVEGTRYIVMIAVVSLVYVYFLARPFLLWWMGPEYEYLAPHACVLCTGMAMFASSSAADKMLRGMGRLRMVLTAMFIGSVLVCLVMIVFLYITLEAPLHAMAWGLASGYAVTAAIRIVGVQQLLKIRWQTTLWRCWGQLLSTVALPFAAGCWIIQVWAIDLLSSRLAIACMTTAFTLVVFYLAFFEEDERRMARQFISSLQTRICTFVIARSRN